MEETIFLSRMVMISTHGQQLCQVPLTICYFLTFDCLYFYIIFMTTFQEVSFSF